eukprot:TRINITY_DN15201_c0_g3_i2.p1 TRINITY_DN15201_c0_g3~~TRINITY_DN15201_c0_g3_i2.p1  ORF type:complete len:197 (+),score=11.77 TRINITY_DN15201_c0_g3_i2:207-797(+)
MFVKNPFYDQHRPAVLLPKHQVSATRRTLLRFHTPVKNYHSADIQIRIHNPHLSSKQRDVGHAVRHSFSGRKFRSVCGITPRAGRGSVVNSPVLTRLLVSQKKLKYVKCEPHSVKAMDDGSEGLEMGRSICKLSRRDKKHRVEEAMSYLRKLSEALRMCYKKTCVTQQLLVQEFRRLIRPRSKRRRCDGEGRNLFC